MINKADTPLTLVGKQCIVANRTFSCAEAIPAKNPDAMLDSIRECFPEDG
jgi:hypothetical protein